MKSSTRLITELLVPFPFVLNFLRILRDKRYFYHVLQGRFTSVELRNRLKKIEKFFYRRRTDLKEYFVNDNLEKNNLSSFVNQGIILNPILIKQDEALNIKNSLNNFLCHDPEDNEKGFFKLDEKPEGILRAYYKCEDLVRVPAIIKIANNPQVLGYVSKYLGALPSIDSIYAWWSFPSEGKALTQSYHRDIDTLHAIKFFIYLTDVDSGSGPHVYIKSSMKSNIDTKKDKSHSDEEIESYYSKDKIMNITGKAGFNFLGDTFSFHKGLTPSSKPRLLLQIYYSLKSTPFGPKRPYIDSTETEGIGSNEISKLVNKNIINYL